MPRSRRLPPRSSPRSESAPAACCGRNGSGGMDFELPPPSLVFDVALDDGAKVRMRRHGNPDGVRLLLAHGNGLASDAYFPYWQHLLPAFDLLVFDFRNHGQNVPVAPSHHTYEQLTRDL